MVKQSSLDKMHLLAEHEFENYDFSPYRIEASDGWQWEVKVGEWEHLEFTRILYALHEDADESEDTERLSFSVIVERGKVVEVSSR